MGLLLMVGGSIVVMSDRYKDEGAVAAIHELAGAPDPVLQQLFDIQVPVDKEVEGHLEKDSDVEGGNDHLQDMEAHNNERAPQSLHEDDDANPLDAVDRDFPHAGIEDPGNGWDPVQLDTKTLFSHALPDEVAEQQKAQENPKEVRLPGDLQRQKPPEEKESLDQVIREKIISDEQEEVLDQQKQVVHEQRQVSDQQEKVSDRQEIVSDQLKIVSDQQKELLDQQKEVSEQQEQISSQHQRVSDLNKDVSDLKDQLSELKDQFSDLISEKNPMPDEGGPTIGSAIDVKKQEKVVSMKADEKLKSKGGDVTLTTSVTEKAGKKTSRNSGKKIKKKKTIVD